MFSMNCHSVLSVFTVSILFCCSLIHCQQPYVGKTTTNCSNTDNSALGYSCNGLNKSCQGYLIFRSQPSYSTVDSISRLFDSDPSRLSAINAVSRTSSFETNKLVIVPVNCSCTGSDTYYQANTSYVVQSGDSYFGIANNTYQGLSTCQAMQDQNRKLTTDIYSGESLLVPVRCACPTKNQSDLGINYLLSYAIIFGETVSAISILFGADVGLTLAANDLSEQNSEINPFTTLLVPLENPPSSSQTITPPPPPASPPPPTLITTTSNNGSNKTWVYVVVSVLAGAAVILVLGIIIFCVLRRRTRKGLEPYAVSQDFEAREKPVNKNLDEEPSEILEDVAGIAQSIKVYKFKELQTATDDFSPSCWIKGSVYRGLINGDFAAIKKVDGDVSKEINLLNKINHFNVIHLAGVCFNDGHWYLVYEYAINGQLSDWIYDQNGDGKCLTWNQRIQIALDVATGLNYLHSFTNPPHVHKDIRSNNILLDSDFRAKIGDLALARSTEGEDGAFALTRHIVGTKGYMAPEYLENGLVSTKLDVYSFGILLLEIVTGKEVASIYSDETTSLSDRVDHVISKDAGPESVAKFLDPSFQGNYPSELAVLVLSLVSGCINKNPAGRPAMHDVVPVLSRILNSSLTWELSTASGYDSFSNDNRQKGMP